MTDDDLDAIFKAGNEVSYAQALRNVYTQGIMDAVAKAPEVVQMPSGPVAINRMPDAAQPQVNQAVSA